MSFFSSLVTTKIRDAHDSALKAIAKRNPSTAAAVQIEQWQVESVEYSKNAATAASAAKAAADHLVAIKTNIAKYTAAAEKLASAGNEDAANKAADQALSLQAQLESAQREVDATASFAADTLELANKAQQQVVDGLTAVEAAKREQARAAEEAKLAEQRLATKERMSGITHGLSGTTAAIDAMTANAKADREKAAAANIRAGVLGKSSENDDAIAAAIAEVDGTNKPKSLAEKMAALKSV
jgi:hypothetical protein